MLSLRISRWSLLAALLALGLTGLAPTTASAGDDLLKPGRPVEGAASLADIGAAELERLPWGVHVLKANLSSDRPVAITGAYLMADDLVCVTRTGLVYCMARRDLQPRWVSSLKAKLVQPPAEGPGHYAFVVQSPDGSYWLNVFAKRNGAEPSGYPTRLPYAVSSGPGVGPGEVFLGSLGSVRDAKTLVSHSLVNGQSNWSYRTTGLIWAAPTFDPLYSLLVVACEDGRVVAFPASSNNRQEAWISDVTGPVSVNPVVTPAHVLVGAQDGTLTALELGSGAKKWMAGLDAPIKGRDKIWVVGRTVSEKRATGVEGAPEVDVTVYKGLVFARNELGMSAFILEDGRKVFQETRPMAKPLGRNGRWVLTVDEDKRVLFRDAQDGFDVKAQLDLRMFDLLPTNSNDGAIYAVTHDGAIVAAMPR